MRRGLVGVAGASLAALALVAAACGGGKSGGNEAGSTGAPQVSLVSLKDFVITGPATVKGGAVTFSIVNEGPSVHEFVVMKTDLTLADLPTTVEDGVPVVDEESTDLQAVDEKEDIAAGTTATLPVMLAPGHYVMFCNIPGHFESGMVADFTVTG